MESGIRTKFGDIDGEVQSRVARRLSSPSPRPSPHGRGRIVASLFARPRLLGLPRDGMWDSLSLGERAGVRGKVITARETDLRNRPTFSQCWLAIFIGCVFSASAAYACKYNVRDVGFV